MKYNHQLFEDISLRSKDRFSQFSIIPESELKSLEMEISKQIDVLNNIIPSDNANEISKEITNLYDLINRGVSLSDEIFKNDLFIKNLKVIMFNPTFCALACNLLSRILYYTDQFGLFLVDFIDPLFKLFLVNANTPEYEPILNSLCNLSYDLISYHFEDDYYDKNLVHPLKTIARNIAQIVQITSGSNFQITLSYILFIRHVAYFSVPSDIESFTVMVQYIKNLFFTPQIQQNDQFISIILWTTFDLCNRFPDTCFNTIVENDFIPYLVSYMKEKNFMFAEPIIGIFYHIVSCCDRKITNNQEPIFDFDLPCIYSLCLSAPSEPIQYEAFQFVHRMTETHPFYMYSHDVVSILAKSSSINTSYKIKKQILWIACILISRNDISYLTPVSMKSLLEFIVNIASSDETYQYLAIESLVYFMRTMLYHKKNDLFEQLFAESGVSDFIEELRDTTNEEIYHILEIYDNMANETETVHNSLENMNQAQRLLYYDDGGELNSDDIDLIEDYHMLSDDDNRSSNGGNRRNDNRDDDNDDKPIPKITFFCSSNNT